LSAEAMAEMWLNLTNGYTEPEIKRIFPLTFPKHAKMQVIELTNIRFYTLCEHHGLPFFGYMHYAYIPWKVEVGLSKPARALEHFSHRLTTQEKLTHQVSEYLWKIVEPVAHVVETEAVHLCSIMRGVRTPDESVRVRDEKVNQAIYDSLGGRGHLYHLIKDLLSKKFIHKEPIKFL